MSSSASTFFCNIALGFFILQAIGIGLLPVLFGFDGLYLCSLGSLSYGLYSFSLPGRIVRRLAPRAGAPSGERCVRDLIRGWAVFCTALGAMGLAICLEEETSPSPSLHRRACAIFILVGIVSILWDVHLMRSKHWEAESFLLVNVSANAAICIAAISSMLKR